MEVYSKSILEFGVDMDHFIHSNIDQGLDTKEDWNELAEYAKYIKNINDHHLNQKDYDRIVEFMANHDQGTDEVARESIFRGLMKEQNHV